MKSGYDSVTGTWPIDDIVIQGIQGSGTKRQTMNDICKKKVQKSPHHLNLYLILVRNKLLNNMNRRFQCTFLYEAINTM